MRIQRETRRKPGGLGIGGPALQIYEFANLGIWAVVFVAAGIILEKEPFNTLAPFLAFGMVLSTMVVHWARRKR
ncbi:MAG: hypothetical protein JSU77_04565 [Fidelibacterota bacterium]|nr:MAG: hypothetical protein JSU77_04565 [Candidatus Neomarinimicrobiota bacterium]